MQEKLIAFIDFVNSPVMLYIIIGCWLINVAMLKRENKTLNKKLANLQQDNAKFQRCLNGSASSND
ncbi:MAG: hypothetical protein J6T10_23965 [Methanobrevibacter sp.]|nr:hypothetical protein [Methanobrevibacter sp.]